MKPFIVAALMLAVFPCGAVAQGYDPGPDLALAAEYWHRSTPANFIVDQPTLTTWQEVDEEHRQPEAIASGEDITVGDYFLADNPAHRCATITHEYGHLLGYADNVRYPNDPVYVMNNTNTGMPEPCARVYLPLSYIQPDERTMRLAALKESVDELRALRRDCLDHSRTRRKRQACRAQYLREVRDIVAAA
jgi:hypothetical protein